MQRRAAGLMHTVEVRSRGKRDFLEGLRKVAAQQSVFPYSLGSKLDGSRCHTFSDSLLSNSFLVKEGGNTTLPSHAPVHLGKNCCGGEMISNTSETPVPFRRFSFSNEDSAIGHMDYHLKECLQNTEHL